MSRQERQSEFSTHGNNNSRINAGFDGSHGGTSDSFSHGGQQITDWPKEADEMLEEFLTACPGRYGTSGNFRNTSLSSERENPGVNVSFFVIVLWVKIAHLIVIIIVIIITTTC